MPFYWSLWKCFIRVIYCAATVKQLQNNFVWSGLIPVLKSATSEQSERKLHVPMLHQQPISTAWLSINWKHHKVPLKTFFLVTVSFNCNLNELFANKLTVIVWSLCLSESLGSDLNVFELKTVVKALKISQWGNKLKQYTQTNLDWTQRRSFGLNSAH